MSRTQWTFAFAGALVAAGAAGCTVAALCRPASGAKGLRWLSRGTRHQHWSMGRAWEVMVDRAAERAREEFKKRRMSCAS